jgi:hypothetical protein
MRASDMTWHLRVLSPIEINEEYGFTRTSDPARSILSSCSVWGIVQGKDLVLSRPI